VPNEDDDQQWRTMNIKEEIELGCVEENTRRSTQANNTPSLLLDTISKIGWTASMELANRILQGKQDNTYIHPCLCRILPFLQKPAVIAESKDISMHISADDYI
jgi:hypothetical protein